MLGFLLFRLAIVCRGALWKACNASAYQDEVHVVNLKQFSGKKSTPKWKWRNVPSRCSCVELLLYRCLFSVVNLNSSTENQHKDGN